MDGWMDGWMDVWIDGCVWIGVDMSWHVYGSPYPHHLLFSAAHLIILSLHTTQAVRVYLIWHEIDTSVTWLMAAMWIYGVRMHAADRCTCMR